MAGSPFRTLDQAKSAEHTIIVVVAVVMWSLDGVEPTPLVGYPDY